eukprot:7741699-Ditylum_brightwellii.AAC.1
MMTTIGYLIGESAPTITYGMNVHNTIANNQIPEVPGTVLFPFFLAQNKELNNGRLAMLAAAGMFVQEQINGKGILEHLGF